MLGIDDRVYAIDMASTNGVWHEGAEVRARRMTFEDRLELAKDVAWVGWQPVH